MTYSKKPLLKMLLLIACTAVLTSCSKQYVIKQPNITAAPKNFVQHSTEPAMYSKRADQNIQLWQVMLTAPLQP